MTREEAVVRGRIRGRKATCVTFEKLCSRGSCTRRLDAYTASCERLSGASPCGPADRWSLPPRSDERATCFACRREPESSTTACSASGVSGRALNVSRKRTCTSGATARAGW